MNIATIWGIAKVAATKIPWGRVMENIPVMVDMAKERFRGQGGAPRGDVGSRLRELEEENRRLAQALLETSGHLQQSIRTLKVVLARQKMMMFGTFLSFAMALAALVLSLR